MDNELKKTSAASQSLNEQSLTTQNELVNDYDIDAYLATRSEFIQKVNKIMVEGKDYHVIQGKKSMAKGGAEKIAAIFGWQAMFLPDDDTIKMLGTEKGVIAYICKLQKGSQYKGEGRGARSLAQDKGDVNKAIKMASKSAFVDAVLRTSGLSDFYTQDLEDMKLAPESHQTQNPAPTATETPKADRQASDKQIGFVKSLMTQKGISKLSDIGLREEKPLSSAYASTIIKRLMEHQSEDKIINLEDYPK